MDMHASVRGSRSPSRSSRFLRVAAAVLALVALAVAIVAAMSFSIANRIMRRDPIPVGNFPANVMPAYSIVGFTSLDNLSLSGWLFPAKGQAVATVVMVHDDEGNRLAFGDGTPELYRTLVAAGFNVLSFDLRHSGESQGRLTTFGYAEWQDVLAAVDYARRATTTTGVVLYGIGSGAGAALAAWERLPATEADRAAAPAAVARLPFTRDYVKALVLDGPDDSPDDAVRRAMERIGASTFPPLPATVPIAVRMSAGADAEEPLSALASRFQRPMLVIETRVAGAPRSKLLQERLRLQPETTVLLETISGDAAGAYDAGRRKYLDVLVAFVKGAA